MPALIDAILLGVGSGAFSLFLDSCMGERMIFRRYRLWLERMGRRNKHLAYWLKPAGLCIYCFSEWVFIAMMLITEPSIIAFCVGSGFNYLTIDLWNQYLNRK